LDVTADKMHEVSLSKQDRENDKALALQLMLKGIGENRINMSFFDTARPPLNVIRKTSWVELQQEQYVAPLFGLSRYALTGAGWLRALRHTGKTKDPVFQRDVGKLFATLKKQVKGRERDGMVTLAAAAQESGLSESWIFNAIESNLLEYEFQKKGAKWCQGFEGTMIFVPVTFGLET
jgi:hypothetical protein